MKTYILKQGTRILGVFEDYDYSLVIKAKYQDAEPLEKFHVEEWRVTEGTLEPQQVSTDTVALINQECETVAVVNVEADLYEGARPSFMLGEKIVEEYYKEFKLESALIFGDTVESLGLSEELTRWINNEVDNCIYELNGE